MFNKYLKYERAHIRNIKRGTCVYKCIIQMFDVCYLHMFNLNLTYVYLTHVWHDCNLHMCLTHMYYTCVKQKEKTSKIFMYLNVCLTHVKIY